MRRLFKKLFIYPPFLPLFLAAGLIEGFWSAGNLTNMANQMALDGILAAGLVTVMIAAGFDLSIGVVMAVAGVVAIQLVPYGLPVAIFGAGVVGVCCGLLNGVFISVLRINPFIASFATMVMFRGAILSYTDTRPVVNFDPVVNEIGRGTIFGVPYIFIIMILVMMITHMALATRPWGRHVYAVGSNEHAARLAGLPVRRIKIQVYALCSLYAALAGALLAARLSTGSPIVGESTALYIAAAVLLGGATLRGGEGDIPGTFMGLAFIAILVNSMNLLNIPAYYQKFTIGCLLVVLVILDGALAKWRQR